MKLEIFDIFDSAVGKYNKPFFMLTKGEATRAFVDIINDNTTALHKHPEDFTLFHLGSFNQETAEFETLETPTSMGKAIQYVLDGHAHDVFSAPAGHIEGRPLMAGAHIPQPNSDGEI